jgi:hypothetical protein
MHSKKSTSGVFHLYNSESRCMPRGTTLADRLTWLQEPLSAFLVSCVFYVMVLVLSPQA